MQNDLHSAPLLHSELLHSNSLFALRLTAEQTLNPPVPLVIFYFASKVAKLNSAFVFCVWWMDLVFLNFIDTSLCSVRAPTSTCQTHFASLRYPLRSTAGTEIFLRSQICRKGGGWSTTSMLNTRSSLGTSLQLFFLHFSAYDMH